MVHRHEPEPDSSRPPTPGGCGRRRSRRTGCPTARRRREAVYRLIHDELLLDGSSRLNMATFVTTWMEPEADRLMAETFDKNMIDKDEYPQTAEIERRCVNIVADLFNAPTDGDAVGVSTIGSSEAVMLGGLAMKWTWRARQEAAGRPTDRPNMVLGSNVQVVWEKFCRYWDVEPRYVPVARGRYVVDPDDVMARVDENTIGVIPILGTTFTGEFEPIGEIHDRVVAYNAGDRLDVPIHVDAASGGFVAPFLHPDLEWDFRLPQVKSINVSGHKYGLTYPGVGFVVWRSQDDLPDDLVFHVNYLGGDMPTFTLNFSRPGQPDRRPVLQLRAPRASGYTRIMEMLRDIAVHLSTGIAEMGELRGDQRRDRHPGDRVHGARRLAVHGVPRLRPAADVGLAGARVHDAGRRHRRRRAPHRRARGVQHGPGRLAARRAAQGRRAPARRSRRCTRRPPAGSATPERRATACDGGDSSAEAPGAWAGGSPGSSWSASFLFALGSFPPYAPDGRSGAPSGSRSSSARCSSPSAAAAQLAQTAPRSSGDRRLVWAARRAARRHGAVQPQHDPTPRCDSLDIEETNRLVWAPDFFGSIAFLVASHLAWVVVCHRLWCVRRDDADWWVAALNYLGSIFFMALGDRVVHADDDRRGDQHHHRQLRHVPRRGVLLRRRLPAAPCCGRRADGGRSQVTVTAFSHRFRSHAPCTSRRDIDWMVM